MTSSLVLVISCDAKNCKKTCGSAPGIYKDVWRNARAEGWIHKKDYGENSIGRDTHFCPRHAKKKQAKKENGR